MEIPLCLNFSNLVNIIIHKEPTTAIVIGAITECISHQ